MWEKDEIYCNKTPNTNNILKCLKREGENPEIVCNCNDGGEQQ